MGSLAIEVTRPQKEGESGEFRSFQAPKAPITAPFTMPDVKTLHDLVTAGCMKYSKHNALGQREFIKLHTEKKEIVRKVDGEDKKVTKEWQYFELGPYNWKTFAQVSETRKHIGAALVKVGVTPGERRFHLYAKTCREWMETAIACSSQNITIVTAYDTLGVEGLRESINQTGTHGIMLDKDNLVNLAKVLDNAPSIKVVVYRDSEGELNAKERETLESIKKFNNGIEVYSYSEFEALGKQHPVDFHPPKAEDVCCIMYTSGSTGPPKGVILHHSTVIAGVAGASANVSTKNITPADTFLAILPLAHIFEFTAELASFVWGSNIGYGSPKTISDVNMRNSVGDMRELRPSVLVAVPAVFEAIKKGILHKVSATSGTTQRIFWGAYRLKSGLKSWHLPAFWLDSLIFKNIQQATGGRLRYTMNGGAAVSNGTREFINNLIAPLVMGYGLTETNAMCAISSPDRLDMDSTGELVPSITVKLVDVPDAGYFSKNRQGEVWVRGPAVSPGYFKNEKETKDAYTDDGWFKTGDIGEITSAGKLRIVDRKKNLVKTLNGEYIAVERLESLYRSNKYVNNICIFADSDHAKPVAVVVPLEPALKSLAGELGKEFDDNFVDEPKVRQAILKSLQETAKESELRPPEWIAGITLAHDEWTPQNGFVTSAQKVQRKKIQQEYKKGIEKAFESA